jgi:hypothetical protein
MNDIRKVLYSLPSFRVVHVKSNTNAAVYSLVKKVVTLVDLIWLEDIPPIIYDIVRRECPYPCVEFLLN